MILLGLIANKLVAQILKSPLGGFVRGVHRIWILLNEIFLNIETGHSVNGPRVRLVLLSLRGIHTGRAKYNDNARYESMDYRHIRRMIHILAPELEDVLYDIGCGKGRILSVAARRRLKRVVGVELFEELCEAARNNAKRLRGRKTPIEVICADATEVDYSDGTIFVMFNPFGELTMRAVIQAIYESIRKNPRSIRIGYCNPVYERVFLEQPWLEKYASFKRVNGDDVTFWRSKPNACRQLRCASNETL